MFIKFLPFAYYLCSLKVSTSVLICCLVSLKSFITCPVCYYFTVRGTNSINSVDVPLNNE